MKTHQIILLVAALFVSCKQSNSEKIVSSEPLLSDQIPSDFLSFYERFYTDSIYQLSHIIFPLEKKTDTTKWQKVDWKIQKQINLVEHDLIREFKSINGLVFEYLVHKQGQYSIERRYSKSDNTYNLIYYGQQSILDNNSEWNEVQE